MSEQNPLEREYNQEVITDSQARALHEEVHDFLLFELENAISYHKMEIISKTFKLGEQFLTISRKSLEDKRNDDEDRNFDILHVELTRPVEKRNGDFITFSTDKSLDLSVAVKTFTNDMDADLWLKNNQHTEQVLQEAQQNSKLKDLIEVIDVMQLNEQWGKEKDNQQHLTKVLNALLAEFDTQKNMTRADYSNQGKEITIDCNYEKKDDQIDGWLRFNWNSDSENKSATITINPAPEKCQTPECGGTNQNLFTKEKYQIVKKLLEQLRTF